MATRRIFPDLVEHNGVSFDDFNASGRPTDRLRFFRCQLLGYFVHFRGGHLTLTGASQDLPFSQTSPKSLYVTWHRVQSNTLAIVIILGLCIAVQLRYLLPTMYQYRSQSQPCISSKAAVALLLLLSFHSCFSAMSPYISRSMLCRRSCYRLP